MKQQVSQAGLTLVELLLVVGILSVLFGIGFVGISNTQAIFTNNSSASVLISDLKNQQVKAMVGDTEGRGIPDNYGIKILSNKYVLFHGNTYNAADSANFSVPVDTGYTLNTTFPNTTALFASNSGELVNFVSGQNSITLEDTRSGQNKTIQINKYGTVTNFE